MWQPNSATVFVLCVVVLAVHVREAAGCRPINASYTCGTTKIRRGGRGDGRVTISTVLPFPPSGIVIPIRWTRLLPAAASVTTAQLNQQVAVMNRAYAGANIRFKTHSITSRRWAIKCDEGEVFARIAVETAKPGTTHKVLNVVLCGSINGNLGLADFGTDERNPLTNTILLTSGSLPGGKAPYNLGMTLVHEAGHSLGLYHVFEGDSCSGPGDFIGDTPQQRTRTFGCPASKDSCPTKPGRDSFTNFMDYSDDRCMKAFTSGQIQQMRYFVANYKRGFIPAPSPPVSLRYYDVYFKLLGRNNCEERGWMSVPDHDCSWPYLFPSRDTTYSRWVVSEGDWNEDCVVFNYGTYDLEGCEPWLDYNADTPTESAEITLSGYYSPWTFDYIGVNLARISSRGLYLGWPVDCSDNVPRLVQPDDPAYLTVYQLAFISSYA